MELESGFRAIRNSVEREMPPASLRGDLVRQFAQVSRERTRRRVAAWSLTAIAALLLCFIALRRPGPAVYEQASLEFPIEDGFQAVPYAVAPAEGEFVRVVHTEVAPDTLTRMGVFVATASGDSIPVDLVVGQDNAPLAVRVNDENEYKETQ